MATIILWREVGNNDSVEVISTDAITIILCNTNSMIVRSDVVVISCPQFDNLLYPAENGNYVIVLLFCLNKGFVRCRTRTSCMSWST
jgi:hypothetical protein